VLFLFTDDQQEDTIRALGNPHIQTPNLDKLAESGVVFRNAYCMGGYCPAVCLPSRMMTLRGRSWFHVRDLPEDAPSLPRSLNAAGYVTYHHGKSGSTAPKRVHAHFTHSHYLEGRKVRESGHPGRIVADDAIEFLQGWKEKVKSGSSLAQPFFMYLAFAAPHDPRVVIPEYLAMYDVDKIPLPENFLPLHPFDNGEMIIRDERLAAWPRTEKEIRKHLRDYYAVITYLDEQIGRIVRHLKDIGEYDNTIIVFSSDQGLAVGSHGLMGKQNLYEHSMGVPLIFTGPGIPRGRATDAFAYLFDVYPTICDMCGLEIPESLEGRSLAPVIRGKKKRVRDTIFLGYMDVQRAVRHGDWKLIRYPQINRSQLFNLKGDPRETRDLAGDPAYATRVRRLLERLRQQQRAFGDTCALTSETPKPAEVTAQQLKDRAERWDTQHRKRK
jgi:arylsulfatase A-like enzyme